MTWLYASAILLGSCLLFLAQPMCAKMLLPLSGGTPAAWNTCMVFFQAGLLLGYAYAHLGPRWLGVGRHGLLHLVLLIATYFLLPIRLPEEVPDDWHPIAWLLVSLTASVGLPFVLLAAGAPLVQRWYVANAPSSRLPGRASDGPRDPYFLYAASNVGSFLALGIFPFILEPYLPLAEQSEAWKLAYLGCVALLAFLAPRGGRGAAVAHPLRTAAPTWRQRGRWLMLALIPSSLLLSVTTHLTTDIAAIPLLWLIPMAIYLLTFVLVFAKRQIVPHQAAVRWLPLAVIVLLIVMLSEATEPMPVVLGLHLVGFFWLALVCHGELARSRPAAEHLTDFYLCLASGGVLGGALNALLAPAVFPGLLEYPLMIALACFFGLDKALAPTRDDWTWAGGVGAFTAILTALGQWLLRIEPGPVSVAAMFGLPLVVCYAAGPRPARFALCIGAVLLASGLYHGIHGASVYRERSYFGIHRVTDVNGLRRLIHGNTVHGQQSLDPERRHLPLTYYSTGGPIGQLFHALKDDARLERVGVVGLGTGSLAYYADEGQQWTFFEIDPSVERIARDRRLFTFLHDSRGDIRIELGDARMQLKKSDQSFGLIVIDAFGSDAIPVHLLTREALRVYLDRLEPDGLLAFHVSNRYVDLEPVLANLAADARRVAFFRQHEPTKDEASQGIMPSEWLVIARRADDVPLALSGWQQARRRPALKVWTDDFSNLFQVFRW